MAKVTSHWLKNFQYKHLVFFFLLFAGATVCTPIYKKYLEYSIINKTQQLLLKSAQQARQDLEQHIYKQITHISQASQTAEFVTLCAEIAQSAEHIATSSALGKNFETLTTSLLLKEIKATNALFVNKAGIVLATTNPSPYLGKNLASESSHQSSIEESFIRVLMGMNTDISDFAFDTVLNTQALFISTPIFKDFKFQGVLIVNVDTSLLHNSKASRNTQEINFVKHQAAGIAYISGGQKNTKHAFKNFISTEQLQSIPSFVPSMALAGKEGVGITYDSALNKKIAAWSYVPKVDWGVVVETPIPVPRHLFLLHMLFLAFFAISTIFLLLMEMNKPVIASVLHKFFRTPRKSIFFFLILVAGLCAILFTLYYLYTRQIRH